MKRQFIFGTMFAASMAVGAAAQTTGTQQQDRTAKQQSQQQQQVTISGCLQRSDDVRGQMSPSGSSTQPGQTAQSGQTGQPTSGTGSQAGARQDRTPSSDVRFVLTQATMAGGMGERSGTHAAGQTGAQTGQTGTQAGQTGAQAGQTGTQAGQTGTSGTSVGTSGTAGAGKVFQLTGGQNQNLERHVNKRVEVRGTIEHGKGHKGDHSGQAGQTGSTTQPGSQAGTTAGTQPGSQAGTTGTQAGAESGMARQHGEWQSAPQVRVTSVREIAESCTGPAR